MPVISEQSIENCDSNCPQKSSFFATMFTVLLALSCLAVLGSALSITPNSSGMGTHQQLGMQQCGFLQRTNYPCITCGMTTSFALAVRGKLFAAFLNQPAGAILALGTMALALYFMYVSITRKKIDLLYIGIYWKRYFFSGAALLMGVWALQGFRRWLVIQGT